MSVVDVFRNFLSSLQPEQRHNLNLRSCEACSFHKFLNRTHFCTQVQPASTINNVYDAQLCIYYTPEMATTGQITQTERETQASRFDYIQKLYEIVRIDELPNPNLLKNPRFDDGTTFWTVSNGAIIAEGFYADHSLRLGNGADAASAYQYLPPFLGLVLEGGLRHRSNTADAAIGTVYVSYTDGANTSFVLNGTSNAWAFLNITGLTSAKKVSYILVLINAPYIVDVTNFTIFPYYTSEATLAALSAKITACNTGAVTVSAMPNVAQATRPNLLTKPEREDLLLKDVDLAANVALQSVLAAVAGQKHKIYALGYEADADGVYYFSATIGSAFKFARRITKGVFAQTLVHPIVCDTNTVLNFMSTTGNSKIWIQYKTEA